MCRACYQIHPDNTEQKPQRVYPMRTFRCLIRIIFVQSTQDIAASASAGQHGGVMLCRECIHRGYDRVRAFVTPLLRGCPFVCMCGMFVLCDEQQLNFAYCILAGRRTNLGTRQGFSVVARSGMAVLDMSFAALCASAVSYDVAHIIKPRSQC